MPIATLLLLEFLKESLILGYVIAHYGAICFTIGIFFIKRNAHMAIGMITIGAPSLYTIDLVSISIHFIIAVSVGQK